MNKVLVTGGNGLIGQAIVKYHLNLGDDVYTWDIRINNYNDYSNCLGKDLYFSTSPYAVSSITEAISIHKFDIISHQAATVGVGDSQINPLKYIHNNIEFTAELLQSIIDTKCFPKKLILAGSMGPYGEGNRYCTKCDISFFSYDMRTNINIPCILCEETTIGCENNENTNRVPQSFYALTKTTQEEMFRIFSQTYNIPSIILRYFSVYGTEVNPNNPYTGVLSIIINKILNSNTIELNEDGNQLRDLIHCDDIARLHYLVSESNFNNIHTIYNVATGVSISMKDIALHIIQSYGTDKSLLFNNKLRSGDIKDSIANVDKVFKELGWSSTIDINDSIIKYCNYVKLNKHKFITYDTCKEVDDKLKEQGLL